MRLLPILMILVLGFSLITIERQFAQLEKKIGFLEMSGASGGNLSRETLDLALKILECESNFNQEAIGSQGEIGIAQFKKPTFNWMKKMAGKEDLDIYDVQDQIELLIWALKNGYENHWTCHDIVK